MRASTTEPPTTNKEPGNGDQSSTSPRQRYQKKREGPPPFQLPPNGPPGSGTEPRKPQINRPRTNKRDSNQKPMACGAHKTKNSKHSRENCARADQQTKISHREGPRQPDQQLVGTSGKRFFNQQQVLIFSDFGFQNSLLNHSSRITNCPTFVKIAKCLRPQYR